MCRPWVQDDWWWSWIVSWPTLWVFVEELCQRWWALVWSWRRDINNKLTSNGIIVYGWVELRNTVLLPGYTLRSDKERPFSFLVENVGTQQKLFVSIPHWSRIIKRVKSKESVCPPTFLFILGFLTFQTPSSWANCEKYGASQSQSLSTCFFQITGQASQYYTFGWNSCILYLLKPTDCPASAPEGPFGVIVCTSEATLCFFSFT